MTLRTLLLVIEKSKKLRALKNIAIQALPVSYMNETNSWMNTDIFKQWFFDEFVPKVEKHLKEKKLPRRALLSIDNAPSHPEVENLKSGNIKFYRRALLALFIL
ncbi:hypothetical protein AVEN_267345-1 [Araneus ventricosus]|uniref:DDE-1 domain-containing protein n=1 Tax=Araneus ventricosus TaxID=182803 RepID=A0A4Y2DJM1_ARAVE|nr:hypothetical protein AVEN_267345-1 [Araneus ventricosus]